jgi:hypothetical protein
MKFKNLIIGILLISSFAYGGQKGADMASANMEKDMKAVPTTFLLEVEKVKIILKVPNMAKNAINPSYQTAYEKTISQVKKDMDDSGCSKKINGVCISKGIIKFIKNKLNEANSLMVGSSSSFMGISLAELDKTIGTNYVNVFEETLKLNQ